eukprot:scaffold26170_cov40-Phaeocystis_antarctica.AAC.1
MISSRLVPTLSGYHRSLVISAARQIIERSSSLSRSCSSTALLVLVVPYRSRASSTRNAAATAMPSPVAMSSSACTW